MKVLRKIILNLAFILVLGIGVSLNSNFVMQAYALDTRIAFSDPSVIEGNEVTVVLKISSLEGGNLGNANLMLKYDNSYLEFISGNNAEGGAGAIKISAGEDGKQEWVYNLRFKALKAGETNIEVSSDEIYDVNGKSATISKKGSSKVTIAAGTSTSTNANLSSLSVSEGALEPEFNSDTTEYTMNVGADINSINVSAVAAEANSSVEISGNENLVEGENKVNINVKAADGSTSKSYTITVMKAVTSESQASTESKTEKSLAEITVSSKTIHVIDLDSGVKIPENMVENSIEVNGVKVKGWIDKSDAGQNFVLVYGQNSEGEKGFYVYDLKEKTIQRYFFESGASALANYNSLKNSYKLRTYIMYTLSLLSIFLFAIIIYLLTRKRLAKNNDIVSSTQMENFDLKDEDFLIDEKIDLEVMVKDGAEESKENIDINIDIEVSDSSNIKSEITEDENEVIEDSKDIENITLEESSEEIHAKIPTEEKTDFIGNSDEQDKHKDNNLSESLKSEDIDSLDEKKIENVVLEEVDEFIKHNDVGVEDIQDLDDLLLEGSINEENIDKIEKEDKSKEKSGLEDLGLDDDFSIVEI
jgi:hypothetical protein